MTTQAQDFAEQMAKVADSLEETEKVAAGFKFKVVKFKGEERRGLRFEDRSKLYFGDDGKFIYYPNDPV